MSEPIPRATIDALARSIFKEASTYGFRQVDIIRLINELMDLCTGAEGSGRGVSGDDPVPTDYIAETTSDLPLTGNRVLVRAFNSREDRQLLEKWPEPEALRVEVPRRFEEMFWPN